ncbi:hypothetical protein LMH87_002854 [Akanthomyces muscarius]|uniref:Uncharacterized protein n=1 Tax=Akanthomyces muscarius TaxID=2231603 RepID=A0A9W8QAE1_AKAMU|nr:hypothetical protein LMH87_002854 [Akanthomyces muscarius]KAJ4148381.1 hypothetical protein LMH87_002854 [Akanthomyces muscarius]
MPNIAVLEQLYRALDGATGARCWTRRSSWLPESDSLRPAVLGPRIRRDESKSRGGSIIPTFLRRAITRDTLDAKQLGWLGRYLVSHEYCLSVIAYVFCVRLAGSGPWYCHREPYRGVVRGGVEPLLHVARKGQTHKSQK